MPQHRGMDTFSNLTSYFRTVREAARGLLQRARPALAVAYQAIRDRVRVAPLLLLGLLALWLIARPNPFVDFSQPVKVALLAWLVCKVSVLAYIGYWIDRLMHPKSRPGSLKDIERMAAEKRRAFIVCACIIAAGFFA